MATLSRSSRQATATLLTILAALCVGGGIVRLLVNDEVVEVVSFQDCPD